MKKLNHVTMLIPIILLITGCQPTPEKEIVVHKGSDALKQAIEAPAVSEHADNITVPAETWQYCFEPYETSGVTINIDAVFELPPVTAYPVMKVVPHAFTLQEAQAFVDYFMQGQPIYNQEIAATKSDIAEKIVKLKAQIVEKQNEIKETDDMALKNAHQSFIETLTEDLHQLEMQYEKAPVDNPKPQPAAIEFKEIKNQGQKNSKEIFIVADLGKQRMATASVTVYENNLGNIISFRNMDSNMRRYHDYEVTDTLQGLSVTRQQAQHTAEQTLQSLGILDMQITSTKVNVDVKTPEEFEQAISDPNRRKCYVFYFSPVVNGLTTTDITPCYGIQTDDHNETYDEMWLQERLSISVDDTGVIMFEWLCPGDIIQTLNPNVQLLDIDTIKNIFIQQISFQRVWSASEDDKSIIEVKNIQLGYMRVRNKDDSSYLLLPVWDFIGDWSHANNTSTPSSNISSTQKDVSFLTVNAIDGSVIDRYKGY